MVRVGTPIVRYLIGLSSFENHTQTTLSRVHPQTEQSLYLTAEQEQGRGQEQGQYQGPTCELTLNLALVN